MLCLENGVVEATLARAGRSEEKVGVETSRLRRFTHNLRRESIFFLFFARNPLKSPNSDEQNQGNPSNFVRFCLDLFGWNARRG
jgi:hypothetical protein